MDNKIAYILVFIILAVIVSLGVLILRPGTKTTGQETMQVKVYFASNKDTPDCARVEEFTRTISYTQAVGTATINEMLKGPTMKEGEIATNAIPANTKLLSLYIENGTAYAEFSKEIQNYGGGSCNVGAIRAQIEKTLKQFPTVDKVEISVPGVTNPLQP